MSEKQHQAIGIDLGTTYSAIAWLDDLGRPQTLINAEGDKVTPSAILFEGDDIVVGKEAIKALATEAEHVATCPKRQLGQRFFNQPLAGRQYPRSAAGLCAEQVAGWMLVTRSVRSPRLSLPYRPTSMKFVGKPRKMPAISPRWTCWTSLTNQRPPRWPSDLHKISMRPINPAAYNEFSSTIWEVVPLMSPCSKLKAQNLPRWLRTEDVRLGGQDWDQQLVDLMAEKFIDQFGLNPPCAIPTPEAAYGENAKTRNVPCPPAPKHPSPATSKARPHAELSRDEFQSRTSGLLERTRFTTEQTLAASGLDWNEIDRVLLVGGSTRMPAIRGMLQEISGKEPDTSISPDEAVAHGAALRAGYLLAKARGEKSRFRIKNVNSHSLGVVGTDPTTKRDRVAVLIPRNTPIPVTAKRIFKTKTSNQSSILVRVVEGESPAPGDCVPLGECIVDKLPPHLPAQTPIEVRFAYMENGRLNVQVQVGDTQRRDNLTLLRENSLSRKQLDDWRKFVSKVPPPDADVLLGEA